MVRYNPSSSMCCKHWLQPNATRSIADALKTGLFSEPQIHAWRLLVESETCESSEMEVFGTHFRGDRARIVLRLRSKNPGRLDEKWGERYPQWEWPNRFQYLSSRYKLAACGRWPAYLLPKQGLSP